MESDRETKGPTLARIIQVAYEVPEEIFAKLATGELTRLGSVAFRDRQAITGHLKEVPIPQNSEGAVLRLAEVARENKIAILIGIGVVLAVGGVALWAAGKKKSETGPELPDWVAEYNVALGDYLDALGTKSLDIAILERLISATDAVAENASENQTVIEATPEQLLLLIATVADYTARLADANSSTALASADRLPVEDAGTVAEFRHYLHIQRQIFDEAD